MKNPPVCPLCSTRWKNFLLFAKHLQTAHPEFFKRECDGPFRRQCVCGELNGAFGLAIHLKEQADPEAHIREHVLLRTLTK